MNKLFVVASCILLLGCASMQPQVDIYQVAYIGTAVTDTTATMYVMNQGGVETNPIYGGTPAPITLVGAKLAGWFLLKWVDSNLPDNASPWMKFALWTPMIALQTYSTIHNTRLGNKLK
jgi:hypothetical protein